MTPSEIERAYADGRVETIIFHRAEGFYALELPIGDDLSKHAECNPGTLKITDATGALRWEATP